MKCKLCRYKYDDDNHFCARCGSQLKFEKLALENISTDWLIVFLRSIDYQVNVTEVSKNLLYAYREDPSLNYDLIIKIQLAKSYLQCSIEFPISEVRIEHLLELNSFNSYHHSNRRWFISDSPLYFIISDCFKMSELFEEKDLLLFFNSFPGDLDYDFLGFPHLESFIRSNDISFFKNICG